MKGYDMIYIMATSKEKSKNDKFVGSVKVGPKGQIIIPAVIVFKRKMKGKCANILIQNMDKWS